MNLGSWAIFLVLQLLNFSEITTGCTLCLLRTPPRPRPLDQYQIPTFKAVSLEKMPPLCKEAQNLPIDGKCRQQFEKIFCSMEKLADSFNECKASGLNCSDCAHAKNDNLWVARWIDSVGKPSAGISDGNYYWLGDYEICENLREQSIFDGQYCRIELEVPDAQVEVGCPQTDPLAITIGACFPSTCSIDQLSKVVQQYSVYKSTVDCESEVPIPIVGYILVSLLVLWLTLQIFAVFMEKKQGWWPCFSLKENGLRALSTKRDLPEQLHMVHGLEFVLYLFYVIGCVYNFMLPYIENAGFSFEGVGSVWMHPTNNYSYTIDGLFALSSLSSAFLLYGAVLTKTDALNFIKMRVVRFWPSYALIVLFMLLLFPGISYGPMWIHSDIVDRCDSNFWKDLLFINNFFDVRETCVDIAYIVSLEAQFFVLLVALMYLAKSKLKLAKILAGVALVASIVLTFFLVFFYSLPPAPMLTIEPIPMDETISLLNKVMLNPLCRVAPYSIGFFFGCFLADAVKDKTFFLANLPAIIEKKKQDKIERQAKAEKIRQIRDEKRRSSEEKRKGRKSIEEPAAESAQVSLEMQQQTPTITVEEVPDEESRLIEGEEDGQHNPTHRSQEQQTYPGDVEEDMVLTFQAPKYYALFAWSIIPALLWSMFGLYWYAAYFQGSRFYLALYAALHRSLFAYSLLMFVYLCHYDYFPWINGILSWRVFFPLSKLTWLVIQIAEPIIIYFFSSLHRPSYATNWGLVSFTSL
ncbi:hypothetical protein WR25_16533 isoform B [Diploscapter pachys]|uniref:Nose resistant-to-fluoxetine protein N-terminal domain-containing protein n=1 Tax=Diploscapter pachys TaxID=2018661 RepID=A0A2A2JTE4_9BILA|nr:hypothetical protein WR25_16533 isoform B [Diploscapter pachys]